MNDELRAMIRTARWDQRCPNCDRDEAAGWYCTGCAARTEVGWLFRPVRGHRDPERIAALQRGRAAKRAQNKEQESGPTPLRDK